MITRYQDDNITNIWSEESITRKWLHLELLVLEGWLKSALITSIEFDTIKNGIKINISRWKEIEKETKHEFAAFVKMLEESIGNESSKWLHYGLTSSDILDSSTMMNINETLEYVSVLLYDFYKVLNEKKLQYGEHYFCGRTHGRIAEKQSINDLFFRWEQELKRCIRRLENAKEDLKIIKLSGPVGNYSTITKEIEIFVANKLGFQVAKGSSQIISRDIFVDYFYSFAMIASLMEKITTTIRLLSMDGIDEMSEEFTHAQIGSSAMPHKRNPILSENVAGLSRMVKTYLLSSIENNNSWLERDMSHSSVERLSLQDSAHLICHSLKNITNIIKGLHINIENMDNNCEKYQNKLVSHTKLLDNIKSKKETRYQMHGAISSDF